METELFFPLHSSEENNTEPCNVPPEPDLARQSLGDGRAPSLSQTRLARQDEISDMEIEKVAESIPKEILAPGSERTVEAETECTEEKDDRSKGRCQESPEGAEKGLRLSLGKENLNPGSENASSTERISQKRRLTPQRQEQTNFHGNSPDEELSSPKQPLKTGMLVAGIEGEKMPLYITLCQGSPTSGPRPIAGLWAVRNQAVEGAGGCTRASSLARAAGKHMPACSVCMSGRHAGTLFVQMELRAHMLPAVSTEPSPLLTPPAQVRKAVKVGEL